MRPKGVWVVTWLPSELRGPVRVAPLLPPKPAEMAFDNQKDAIRLAMNLPADQDVELHLPGGQILERSVIEQMLGVQVLADEEYGAGWPR
jgi:hypothetical protein